MNLKILFMLLVYYGLISMFFLVADSEIISGYNTTIELNSSGLQEGEVDTGGIFGTGVSFSRFFSFVGFGVGLPSDTPAWFSVIFIIWQSIITIMAVGFVISSIWNG